MEIISEYIWLLPVIVVLVLLLALILSQLPGGHTGRGKAYRNRQTKTTQAELQNSRAAKGAEPGDVSLNDSIRTKNTDIDDTNDMIEGARQLARQNPDAVADLLRHWINTDKH